MFEKYHKFIKMFMFFIAPYRWAIGLQLLLYILSAALEVGTVLAVSLFTSALTKTDLSGIRGSDILNKFILFIPGSSLLMRACLLLAVFQISKSALSIVFEAYNGKVASEIMYSIRNKMMNRYLSSRYEYFLENKLAELIYFAHNAPDKPAVSITFMLSGFVEFIKAAVILFTLFIVSWKITIGVLLVGLIFVKINSHYASKISYNSGQERIGSSNRSLTAIQEFITGIKQVKVFNVQKKWANDYNTANKTFSYYFKTDAYWLAVSSKAFELFVLGGCMLFLAFVEMIRPNFLQQNFPLISIFIFGLMRAAPSISSVARSNMNIMSRLPDTEKIYNILNSKIDEDIDGSFEFSSFKKSIQFGSIGFSYKGRNKVLKNISLEIKKGKTTALVGSSGSGKTTILNLLFRLYRTDEGSLTIDGKNINELKLDSWLKNIGYVSQDPFIFHGSIFENIIFGRPHITLEQVQMACKKVGANSFIDPLKDGYYTIVGERGMMLSGGQQQRLAIARALVENPEIIVFDEATSALDNVSEKLIQDTINELSKEKTIIVIAHRVNTIKDADIIYVLKDGVINQSGKYNELLAIEGEFKRLYFESQGA